ncbi:MAG: phage late control D family protein, partial [Deltaproteobacteria bacterium]|nr:phage late control D family protein [Deltaproteobacteria bacterium]
MRDVRVLVASPDFSCDGLEVTRLVGRERLSRLYEFDVEVVARRASAVPTEELVGGAVRILLTSSEGAERLVAGLVAAATERLDPESELRGYRLRVVPLAYRMTQIRLQEAFAGTVPSIVTQKLDQCGVPYEFRTSQDYPSRDFVAQFGETDLDFACRLAEHVGLAFAFEPHPEGDRLVLTDDNRFPGSGPGLAIPFRGRGERLDVHRLELEARMSPSMCLVSDYNYRNPELEIVGRFENQAGTGGGFIEYGVHARTPEEAAWLAKVRGEALECQRRRVVGESDRIELVPGREFKLEGLPSSATPGCSSPRSSIGSKSPRRGRARGASRTRTNSARCQSARRFARSASRRCRESPVFSAASSCQCPAATGGRRGSTTRGDTGFSSSSTRWGPPSASPRRARCACSRPTLARATGRIFR